MRSNAAAMLLADYRTVGVPDLVCISDRGEGNLKLKDLPFYLKTNIFYMVNYANHRYNNC